MSKRWICFVAARYVFKSRKNSASLLLSMLGIATGVLALTIIISVMNGFQIGFIESILEISSYHLRLDGFPAQHADKLRALPEVTSVLPFRETSVLLRGRQANPRSALIRGVPPEALELDSGLDKKLYIEDGSFDLENTRSILIGTELARFLSVREGQQVNLLSISDGFFTTDSDEENSNSFYTVSGIFRSGFYEYDLGWAFVNLDAITEISEKETQPLIGIKLKNRWQDQKAIRKIQKLITDSTDLKPGSYSLESWRDYNRAFFSALRTEKLVMFFLVGLIFIVVGLNIFQAQRRTVLERQEEIGLLRALGASDTAVRLIFVLDGFIIGFLGASVGLAAGLFISLNISSFFALLEKAVNSAAHGINIVLSLFGNQGGAEDFALFSPKVFYIKEIPSVVIAHEVILIFMFGFLSALIAAWFASGKISSVKPAEVLRYE